MCTGLGFLESRRESSRRLKHSPDFQDFVSAHSVCLLAVVTNIGLFFLCLNGPVYLAESFFPVHLSYKCWERTWSKSVRMWLEGKGKLAKRLLILSNLCKNVTWVIRLDLNTEKS